MGDVRAHVVEMEFRGAVNVRTDRVLMLDVTCDMLELADQFSITLPWTKEMHAASRLDAEVVVYVDRTPIFCGYIDDRRRVVDKGQAQLQLSGRDKGGRLVDESAPLTRLEGMTLLDLGKAMCGAWFPSVVLSNERNRKMIGAGARVASVGREPLVRDPKTERLVQPGESRAKVLMHFLERAGCLGWSSNDGLEFVIGEPNHTQAPQWSFFHAAAGSKRQREANVENFSLNESIAERYARIRVVGSSRGDAANYGKNVTHRYGEALAAGEGFGGLIGVGGDFLRAKSLIVADDDVKTAADAQARAEQEMLSRDSRGRELVLTVPGFGQGAAGTPPALYKFDKVARFEDEETGEIGDWFVTRVGFRLARDEEMSVLTMVPRGTPLRSAA